MSGRDPRGCPCPSCLRPPSHRVRRRGAPSSAVLPVVPTADAARLSARVAASIALRGHGQGLDGPAHYRFLFGRPALTLRRGATL